MKNKILSLLLAGFLSLSAFGQKIFFKNSGSYKFGNGMTPNTRSGLVSAMLKRTLGDVFIPVPHRGLHDVAWIMHNGTSYSSSDKANSPASFYPSGVPENSNGSIDAARDLYAMVELDVRLDSNRDPYLLHDQTLGRTVARPKNYTKEGNKRVIDFDPHITNPCRLDKNCVEWNPKRENPIITKFWGKSNYTMYLKSEIGSGTTTTTGWQLPKLYDVIINQMPKGDIILLLDIQDRDTFYASLNALDKAFRFYLKNPTKYNNPANFVVLKVFTNQISIKDMTVARIDNGKKQPLIMPVIQSRDFVGNASKRTPLNLVDILQRCHLNGFLTLLGIQASWWGDDLYRKDSNNGYKNTSLWYNLISKIEQYNIPLAAYHNAPNLLDNVNPKLKYKFINGWYYKGETGKGTFQKTVLTSAKLEGKGLYTRSNHSWDIYKYIRKGFNILISDTPGLVFADKTQIPTTASNKTLPAIYGFSKIKGKSEDETLGTDTSPQIDLSSIDTNPKTLAEIEEEAKSVFSADYTQPFPCSMKPLTGTATKIAANNADMAMIDKSGKVHLWDDVSKNWQYINIANQKELAVRGGTIWTINNNNRLWTIYPEIDSTADMKMSLKKIAVNAFGRAAGIGLDNKVYLYDETDNKWNSLGGSATEIAVDASGNPWYIGNGNGILKWDGETNAWKIVAGKGKTFATNSEGDVYLVGVDNAVYRWNDENQNWEKATTIQSGLQQIAVLGDNVLVGINASGSIFKSECPINYGDYQQPTSMTCSRLMGDKKALKIATDGQQAAVIATDKTLWLFDNVSWRKLAQNAIDVAIDDDGKLWYVGADNQIYVQNSSDDTWTVVLGKAKKIAIGGSDENKKIAIIGSDNAIYVYDLEGNSFEKIEETFASEIAIDTHGKIWSIGANNEIRTQTDDDWRVISGTKAKKITASSNGVVAIIGIDGNLYSYEGSTANKWQKVSINGFAANDMIEIAVSTEQGIVGIKKNNDISALTKDCNVPILNNLSGAYIIQNVATGKVLDVEAASGKSGAKVIQYQNKGARNQQFNLSVNASGYTISPQHAPNMYLNVCDCENSNNFPLTIQAKNWDIERFDINPMSVDKDGNMVASITSSHSGLDLGVHNAEQAAVMQWEVTWGLENDKRFQWRLIPVNPTDVSKLREKDESEIQKLLHVDIFPNPATDIFSVDITGFNDEEELIIIIADSQGNQVLKKEIGQERKLSFDAEALGLKQQTYVIQIHNGSDKRVSKILKFDKK